MDTDKVTRLEVIDSTGRVFVRYADAFDFELQDDGRTLKVFVEVHDER